MENIMVNENGHDIKLVNEINNLWKLHKCKFAPIFRALSVRDEAKIKEKSLGKHGVFNPEYGNLKDFANCYLNEVADDDTLLIIISYVGNWGSRKDVLMEKILNLPCHSFTKIMRSIGIFGKDDEVLDYSPSDLVCVIDDANREGYDVEVDLPCGRDYYLYIKYSGGYPNATCTIRGLLDDSEDWINTFKLNEIVEKHEAEIEKLTTMMQRQNEIVEKHEAEIEKLTTMTQKQNNLINEMRANNALYADVTYSFKDKPTYIYQTTIKLKPYNENDPADVENDENIFFYFQDIDEMVDAMDSSNKDFDFTIHSIIHYSFE